MSTSPTTRPSLCPVLIPPSTATSTCPTQQPPLHLLQPSPLPPAPRSPPRPPPSTPPAPTGRSTSPTPIFPSLPWRWRPMTPLAVFPISAPSAASSYTLLTRTSAPTARLSPSRLPTSRLPLPTALSMSTTRQRSEELV